MIAALQPRRRSTQFEDVYVVVSLANVLMEIECFISMANLIFLVVDDDGTTGLVGSIPEGDAGNLQIIYQC